MFRKQNRISAKCRSRFHDEVKREKHEYAIAVMDEAWSPLFKDIEQSLEEYTDLQWLIRFEKEEFKE